MSKKDVINYYNELYEQKEEMLQGIKDFEKECENGMIEPERLDKMRENVQPLLRNFERIEYIVFLLNKPIKKERQEKYLKKIKKKEEHLNPDNSLEGVKEENKGVIEKIKNA